MKDDGPVWAFCANTLGLFAAGRALKGGDGARVWLRKQLGMKRKEQHKDGKAPISAALQFNFFSLSLKGNVANNHAKTQHLEN